MNLSVLGRNINRRKSSVVRTFTVIALTLVLSSTTIPLNSYAVMSNPPPRYNVITSTFYRVKNTLFPRPLFVGTLMTGSNLAGLPDRGDEKASMATSHWTNLIANLQTGNHLVTASLLNVPTASGLPLTLQLAHNSMNASIDVGVGKGWMTNLHTCVEEDGQSGDITYMDPSGALYVFSYDSQTQTYQKPKGFAGKITKEANGEFILQGLNYTKQVFGTNGKLTTISEVCGTNPDTIDIVYNGNGNPISATDSLSGRAITLTWDANQKLSSINDPMSNTWSFTQNASNQLTTITQPEDGSQTPPPTRSTTTFSYDGNNLITGHDDFLNDSYEVGYEASSPYKVTSWTDPASNVTSFTYAVASSPYDKKTTVTDAENIEIDYFFGATSKQLEKIQQFDGIDTLKIEMGYNATTGFQTTSKDSYGNTTTMVYDSVGHVVSLTLPPAQSGQPSYVKTITYSTPVSIDSNVTQVQETVTSQQNATTSIAYTDNNNPCLPTSITDPLNQVTTKSYNSSGQITSLVEPTTGGTKTTSFSYSPTTGDRTQVTDPLMNLTTYTYNTAGFTSSIAKLEGGTSYVSDKAITRNQFNLITGTSDNTTGLTSAYTTDANGADMCATSESGCEDCSAFTDAQGNAMAKEPIIEIQPWNPPFQGNITYSSAPYNPNPYSKTSPSGEMTVFTYKDNGSVGTVTNHIGDTLTYVYDDFGRVETITDLSGKTVTYDYDLNSRETSITTEGEGAVSYSYDNAGNITNVTDSVKGSIDYTRNLRGNVTANEKGTYQLDLKGRPLSLSYTLGGSESWVYTPDSHVTSHTLNGVADTYSYDNLGNLTTKNNTTYSYSGTSMVGTPSSQSGGGDSYSFTYDNRHYMTNLNNTSLGQSFNYGFSNSHELNNLSYPNGVNLTQVFSQKYKDSVEVKDSSLQTLVSGQVTRDSTTHQINQYDYTATDGGQNTLAEITQATYHTTGSLKGKINTVSYNTGKPTVTYGYDANSGRTDEVQIAGLGTYDIGYTGAGQIDTITYPNQTQEQYTYNGPMGKVSQISYPNGTTVSMTWNTQERLSSISEANGVNSTNNTFYYTTSGDVSTWIKSVNGTLEENWTFVYGPQGIESASCITPMGNITQNYCTDPSGMILAMYYEDTRGGIVGTPYSGMLYFHYDNFGNTAMLTDAGGVPQVLYQYDLRTSLYTSYNPSDILNPFTNHGIDGAITDVIALVPDTDWTVYHGSVGIKNGIVECTTKEDDCKEAQDPDWNLIRDSTKWGFRSGFLCDCWNGSFGEEDAENIDESLRDAGLTEEEIEASRKTMESEITNCCNEETNAGADVYIVDEIDKDNNSLYAAVACQSASGGGTPSLVTLLIRKLLP